MTKIKLIISAVLIVLISTACSRAKVVPLTDDIYYISQGNARVGFGPASASTVKYVYTTADNFCKKKKLKVQTISSENSESGYGKSATFSLRFRCVDTKEVKEDTTKEPTTNKSSTSSTSERLKELKQMHKDKLITQEEFDVKRKAILDTH